MLGLSGVLSNSFEFFMLLGLEGLSEVFIGLLGVLFKFLDSVLSNSFEFLTLLGLEGLLEALSIFFGLFNVFCKP